VRTKTRTRHHAEKPLFANVHESGVAPQGASAWPRPGGAWAAVEAEEEEEEEEEQ
jgi:hypothetical protein